MDEAQGKVSHEEGKDLVAGEKQVEEGKKEEPIRPVCPYKLEWYQSERLIVVEILIKGLTQDKVQVKFEERGLCFAFDHTNTRVDKELNLAHEIDPNRCVFKVLPSKIEIKMGKRDGIHWSSLEVVNPETKTTKKKDWDKVVADMEEDTKDNEAALNELFQKIYNEGSDEVKKAMNKSFMESGGTELNTNWDSVKQGKVSIKPPQGMEWKQWDS